MNKTKDQEELQTFGSNFTPKRRSLFQSKSFNPGGIDQMFVSVNKPQVPNREDWSHLVNTTTEQKLGSLPVAPKRVTSPVEESAIKRSVVKMKDDEEKSSTLKLRLEAMTWAAMAKDATILALQQRLKAALLSLQNERDANAQLKVELEMSGKEVRQKQQRSQMQIEGDSQQQPEKEAASVLLQQQQEDREQEATVLDSDKELSPSEFRLPLVLDSQQQRQASGFPI
ncbi:hypothetical protein Mapa_016172 [Marchantia paleacea]|nr:hypothetical protein Mapa_016172 [Marchantia paleacea]